MVFSTLLFIFIFLVAVIGVYYLIPNRTYRNVVLLVFSIAFYGWGEPLYVFLMLFSILMNYVFGRKQRSALFQIGEYDFV